MWIEVQKKGIKIAQSSLIAVLRSEFVIRYYPILDYFNNLDDWDQSRDYISLFLQYIILDDGEDRSQFEYHFKKWIVRSLKCSLLEHYFNKQAFILSDDGNGQNIGKTTWCRFLCPKILSNYIAENPPENEKDAKILLAKNFFVNLDELDSLSRKEINKLKSYFTLDKINERLPYDRKNSVISRISSFIGSTNMSTFLQDETGSVRWLCFIIKSINWKYQKDFNIDNLWSQAFFLSKDVNFNSELTSENIRQNEKRNEKFQISTSEYELINKYFEKPLLETEGEFYTATDIQNYLLIYNHGIRFSTVGIGKALKKLGYNRSKSNKVYGYYLNKLLLN